MEANDFWHALDALVATSTITVDRPKGSAHPRYPDFFYPLDYGYLEGTTSSDGLGVDVWLGSLPEQQLTAIICTVDLHKHEAEMKLLLGCTSEEAQTVLAIHNRGEQSAMLLMRPET
jgi:inorganic pyrophosphatase